MDGNSLTQTGPRRHRARAHSDTRRPLRSQPAVRTAGPFAAPKPRSAPHRCLHFDSIRRVSIRRFAAWFTQLTGTAQTSSSVRAPRRIGASASLVSTSTATATSTSTDRSPPSLLRCIFQIPDLSPHFDAGPADDYSMSQIPDPRAQDLDVFDNGDALPSSFHLVCARGRHYNYAQPSND